MKNKYLLFIITICFVLVGTLFYSLNKNCKVEPIKECTTDTLFIYRTDTIIEYRPLYVEKRVVDTMYIECKGDSLISLPIVQKHYNKPQLYDLWISGIEPLNVDSVNVYNKTEYRTVTNTITQTIVDEKPRFYVSAGLNAFSGTLRPNMNISLSSKRKWLYSLEIGLDKDNDVYYGGKVAYRIF